MDGSAPSALTLYDGCMAAVNRLYNQVVVSDVNRVPEQNIPDEEPTVNKKEQLQGRINDLAGKVKTGDDKEALRLEQCKERLNGLSEAYPDAASLPVGVIKAEDCRDFTDHYQSLELYLN